MVDFSRKSFCCYIWPMFLWFHAVFLKMSVRYKVNASQGESWIFRDNLPVHTGTSHSSLVAPSFLVKHQGSVNPAGWGLVFLRLQNEVAKTSTHQVQYRMNNCMMSNYRYVHFWNKICLLKFLFIDHSVDAASSTDQIIQMAVNLKKTITL